MVDILQPCFTYNKLNTHSYFRERVYKLEGNDTSNKDEALELALQWQREDKIPLGIFYQDETKPAYHEYFPQLRKGPLVKQPLRMDIKSIMAKFV